MNTTEQVPYQFTADHIPTEAFEQSTWWRDRDGVPYRITEMPKPYAENVTKFLCKWYGLRTINTPLYKAIQKQALTGVVFQNDDKSR